MLSFGILLALFFSVLFATLYAMLSAFAQALESLSAIRRKSLLVESPQRFGRLLDAEHVRVSRVAVRLTAQGSVLGGFLSLGPLMEVVGVPKAWLVSTTAITLLLGWIFLEGLVIRWVARRGPDTLLHDFWWLIPLVLLFAAPLYPILSRLVDREPDDDSVGSVSTPEKEAAKESEVRAFLDVAREEGILEKHEEELVSRAVDFGGRTVGEVMTPRPDMVVAEADAPLSEIADLFVKTKYTRIPLVVGGVDKPVGVVHVKDVFTVLRSPDPPETARPLGRDVLYAPESQTIATLLADFRRRRQHLAVVVDEYGAVTGLVTLEDLVEELVGEIADEHEDAQDPIVPLPNGVYSVAGRVRVSEVAQLFETTFPPAEYDTVAGLVSARLGHIPRPGESVVAQEMGLTFHVDEADRRRVYRVRVERSSSDASTRNGALVESFA